MTNRTAAAEAEAALADSWACTRAAVVSLELALAAPPATLEAECALALADHDLAVALEALDTAAIAVAAADPLGDVDTSDLWADLAEQRATLGPVRSELQPAAA